MSAIFWFRNDLRLQDNLGLDYILQQDLPPIFIYIFDETKSESEKLGSASKYWLHHSLKNLQKNLVQLGYHLVIRKGDPQEILNELVLANQAKYLSWSRSYAPQDIVRDTKIKAWFQEKNVKVVTFPGNVLIEPFSLQTQSGNPYQVYTPFSKAYFARPDLGIDPIPAPKNRKDGLNFIETLSLEDLNLLPSSPNWAIEFSDYWIPGEENAWAQWKNFAHNDIKTYRVSENLEAKTSLLSPHLHWGEISVQRLWRELDQIKRISPNNGPMITFQKELIWRDFATHLLYHFPKTITENQRSQFNHFPWENNELHFKAWTKGQTGYPIVDAGMRELWRTGFMHNRVRMIVGSFLVKHLLVDWRKGERWFWDTLLDADLASNVMNWQWVAGSGADAAPYFRIFNPLLQAKKFDPDTSYIKKWVPELRFLDKDDILEMRNLFEKTNGSYPKPIVHHTEARSKAMSAYECIRHNSK